MSWSQSRFSSPEVGDSEDVFDPNAVFSPSTQDPTPRRGVGVDLNDSYSGSPALRSGHLFGDKATAQPNRTLFGALRNDNTYVLDKMSGATHAEVIILFPLSMPTSPYFVRCMVNVGRTHGARLFVDRERPHFSNIFTIFS